MANCNQATPDLSPEAMLELIYQCPPGPWPNAWGTWHRGWGGSASSHVGLQSEECGLSK
jgi:hypothetical protein